MEKKYMTLDEIVALSQEIERKWLEPPKANMTEAEKYQLFEEITKSLVELSAQFTCYVNNEVITKLSVTNKSIPAIAAALHFAAESLMKLTEKDPSSKMACMAMQAMLQSRLGTQAVSVDLNALRRDQGN